MKSTRTSRSRILPWSVLAVAIGLAGSMAISSAIMLSLLTQAAIYAIFASGIGVLLRQSGVASFGHAAFFGLGGYIIAILLNDGAVSAETAVILALVGIAVFAFLLGLVIVRVPGIAFAMLTLAFGQLFYQLASNSRSLTGGADGMTINWPNSLFGVSFSTLLDQHVLFGICWVALVLSLAALAWLRHSRLGHVSEAIRDNIERASFIGIQTLIPRALIFAVSAIIVGVAGALSAVNTGFISPESLHWSVSGSALMMVVVGGYRLVWGPAFGAIVFFLAKDWIGDYADHWLALFGIALIIVVVFTDAGISGALNRLIHKKRKGGPANGAVAAVKP
ncbi:MAG: branched-chain amino acid ABC transporter permease [Alcaligenaceae bacterium]|nr:branched-chain amino acid ABC transporter permease [Alcaligenaceae bacterium]